jgi:ribosome biogenesis GTPase / thiamine phosphate phosphatase
MASNTDKESTTGTVIAVRPRRIIVQTDTLVVPCDMRRGLLQGHRDQRNLIAVGDQVALTVDEGNEAVGVLQEVLPRHSKISRIGSLKPVREHVIAANVDQLLALQAVTQPQFNARSLDRFLTLGEVGGISCAVCLNKLDLTDAEYCEKLLKPYRVIGYSVFTTSAITGDGVDEVADFLRGKTTILLGPSGAGKSTLLNGLMPGLDLRTKEVSTSSGRGVHTTTRVDYLPLPDGGVVLDTPGLRSIQPWIEPSRLATMFPEMRDSLGQCRFRDCMHITEPGCAIREKLETGEINADRYESYRRLFQGLKDDLKDIGELPETN